MRYVTLDVTSIQHWAPQPNRQSAEGKTIGERHPKRPKTQKRLGKFMAFGFGNACGKIFTDYFEKDERINSEYNIALIHLNNKIAKKRFHILRI